MNLSLTMKFPRQSWQELGWEIVFWKTGVMKIENYFAKKEICVYQFWENLKKSTSQSLVRNKARIRDISGGR